MLLLGSIRSIMRRCIKIDNVFFSKACPSFLTVKEGSTSLTKPLFPQGREDVTALSADFSTSPSLLQGELHILTKPSLLEKGRM